MLRRQRGRKGGWSSVDEAGGCGIGWRAKRGVGRVTSKGATLARTRTRSHVWALDQVGPRPSSGGECLVGSGRHVPGVAVDRCASFGVVRAGSVLLPGLGVVDRWVGHDCFTCVCCCLRPHTITPLPWRERGIQFPQPQHKNKHTSQAQARGDEQGRHKGAGKGTYTSCSEGGGLLRGGLPTPLSGA
eukprot:scaffold5531_cov126-Isochrysis_galbana.AAC.4